MEDKFKVSRCKSPFAYAFLIINMVYRTARGWRRYYLICTSLTVTIEISSKCITVSLPLAYQQARLTKLIRVCLSVLRCEIHFPMTI